MTSVLMYSEDTLWICGDLSMLLVKTLLQNNGSEIFNSSTHFPRTWIGLNGSYVIYSHSLHFSVKLPLSLPYHSWHNKAFLLAQ